MERVRRIPALRPDVPVPRLSFEAGFALFVGWTVVGNLFRGVLGAGAGPIGAVSALLAVAVGFWVLERRPAVWLLDQANGTIAVHRRRSFFLPGIGARLALLEPAEVEWRDGRWWQTGRLWIDGAGWWILSDGEEGARHLAHCLGGPVAAEGEHASGPAS